MSIEVENKAADQILKAEGRIPLVTKLVYGSGDWGMASFNTLRQIFYAIFLTDVVGLDPRLASAAALVGVIWDAINDPLVGALSDRVNTKWGRRRPFLLIFAIPFGLSFLLLWWAPTWENQVVLMIHITLAYIISDTLQTLVVVPFLSLTPEISPDYDGRTALTGYRMVFNLIASLATAVSAPMIQDEMIKAGYTAQQGYLVTAVLFGSLAAIPFLLMFAVIREKNTGHKKKSEGLGIRNVVKMLWANVPFRYAALLYMLNWITFDLVALMLPFFLVYWVASGDLLASANLFGLELSLESAVLGILLIVAMVMVPLWTWLSKRFSKRSAYIGGMIFWIIVQVSILFVQPGQVDIVLIMAMLAGISVSTAHVLPEAIFPDVIEWDELQTGERHEGIYYGSKNFIRKLTGAVAIFLALQVLGWVGYQAPPEGVTVFVQADAALNAIRLLTGLTGAIFLVGAIVTAWFYPLTREQHAQVRAELLARQEAMTTS